MNVRFAGILDAHCGMDRWQRSERVEATIASGGGLVALKGVPQDSIDLSDVTFSCFSVRCGG